MTDEPMRPDPDRLLEQTAEAHRGKLKIFFGACAGVGKTFAMLTEAQRLRAQGLDILIGVVETHGRKETASLLKGLATQPPRRMMHLHSPASAILSAVIFNALIIVFLIPLALKGVSYKPLTAAAMLRRNLWIYGLGGLVVPFVGIKVIDLLLTLFGLV